MPEKRIALRVLAFMKQRYPIYLLMHFCACVLIVMFPDLSQRTRFYVAEIFVFFGPAIYFYGIIKHAETRFGLKSGDTGDD